MSDMVQNNKYFLHFIYHSEPTQFVLLAKHLTSSEVKVLREIITNLLAGNVILSKEKIEQLKKYRSLLYTIRDRKQIRSVISEKSQSKYKILHIFKDPLFKLLEQ